MATMPDSNNNIFFDNAIDEGNHYAVLNVRNFASVDEIKRAYKIQSLKLHPDKNHAPKATEAFKKVAAAYACLTDSEKRKIYNMTGEEPGNS